MAKKRVLSKKADVVLVGGGSGGHLTPLVPIAEELHKLDPSLRIAHIGRKNDKLNNAARTHDITHYYEVQAGKLRRYHGDGFIKRLFAFKDNALNIRDFFRLLIGTYQAWKLLGKLRPKVLFFKGGYVGVPVGFAARMRRIPYITHDSDAMISLANKIISGGATYHATAQKVEYYKGYDKDKLVQVGLPLRSDFEKVTDDVKARARKDLGYGENDKIIFITGGGQGAQRLNEVIIDSADQLLKNDEDIRMIHITGHKLFKKAEEGYKNTLVDVLLERVNIVDYSDELHKLSAAADVVVTRAGATNMAEFALQAKACIVVPNPQLTGGHQTKNSQIYIDFNAAIVVEEDKVEQQFAETVEELLSSKKKRKDLGNALHKLYIPGAAEKTAKLLLEVAEGK